MELTEIDNFELKCDILDDRLQVVVSVREKGVLRFLVPARRPMCIRHRDTAQNDTNRHSNNPS